MPRSSDYLLEGYTYHLTQRCHNREFLLCRAKDRDVYREWLRQGVKRHGVSVYGFCVTCSHVHVLTHVDSVEDVSSLMHLASGATAKRYNLRKGRTGSMWQHPYQCTIVEDGRHLLNCLTYIDMNMVRAGVVSHPQEWKWCGYDELVGSRRRYRILDIGRLLQSLDVTSEEQLRRYYTEAIRERIEMGRLQRESHWSDSLAVGSEEFVRGTKEKYKRRWTFDLTQLPGEHKDVWTVREPSVAYNA
ncbi:MAG: transposase [Verrucomicrobia bacterium]|jgi:putative transposase|nr:transposase [Verrucomicrobiota bacterium]